MDASAMPGLEHVSFAQRSFHEINQPRVPDACSEAALRRPVAW